MYAKILNFEFFFRFVFFLNIAGRSKLQSNFSDWSYICSYCHVIFAFFVKLRLFMVLLLG